MMQFSMQELMREVMQDRGLYWRIVYSNFKIFIIYGSSTTALTPPLTPKKAWYTFNHAEEGLFPDCIGA